MATTITHAGITRTITENLTQGNYLTGDPWVVVPSGVATLTAISPGHSMVDLYTVATNIVQNGSMKNPVPQTAYCFSDGCQRLAGARGEVNELDYDLAIDVSRNLPATFVAGDILVNCKTYPLYNPNGTANGFPDRDNSVQVYSPISFVATAPAAGDFRTGLYHSPGAGIHGQRRKVHNVSQVNYSLISNKWVAPVALSPTLAEVQALLPNLCWLEWYRGSGTGCYLGNDNTATALTEFGEASTYGRDIADKWSKVALYLMQTPAEGNYAAWQALVNQTIQCGLDIYQYYNAGGILIENGAQKIGRKFPVFLAAVLLNDADMLALVQNPAKFPEDRTTFIVQQSDVGRVMEGARETYAQEHVGLGEWGQSHYDAPQNDDSRYNALYREANWPPAAGYVFSAWLMNQEIAWGHPPAFYYTQRFHDWVNYSGFLGQMWDAYASTLPPLGPANPVISIEHTIVEPNQSVSITCSTAGAAIWYTTNGAAVTAAAPSLLYSAPLTITTDTNLKVGAKHPSYAAISTAELNMTVITNGTPAPPTNLQFAP